MKNVFVYGSLMFDVVWRRLIRHPCHRGEARLPGYRRLAVRGATYPGLVISKGGHVDGVLCRGLRRRDLQVLDRFEGRYYVRVPVRVLTPDLKTVTAEVYLFRDRHRRRLSAARWDADRFKARHLRGFLARFT